VHADSDCNELFGSLSPRPLLLKRPESFEAARGGHVKNLKDLWDNSPDLLDGIGGDQLAGSGFESEQSDREFASQESDEDGKE
jgi:hypothetical protein